MMLPNKLHKSSYAIVTHSVMAQIQFNQFVFPKHLHDILHRVFFKIVAAQVEVAHTLIDTDAEAERTQSFSVQLSVVEVENL